MKWKTSRLSPFGKNGLRAAPVSERAYRTPKIYRKDAWLAEFWQGIMNDFRMLFARPFKGEEKNGELVLYVLGLWKYVFSKDGRLTAWRKEYSVSGRLKSREQQFSFSRDDAVFHANWKWIPGDEYSCPPFFGTWGKAQAEDCAGSLLHTIICIMERDLVFVLAEYYDPDECEFVLHHRSFLMFDKHEENLRETFVDRILRGSRIKKYLARSIRSFFPRFFSRFANFFDATFLEKLADAGWSGGYDRYRLYAGHKDAVLRVLRERPNLLPLLDTVNAGWWERPDLFAADNWTKERTPDMEPETLPPWCEYYGAKTAWHAVSKPAWKMLSSLPASDIAMLLNSGFGFYYDLDKLRGLLKIGRKFPRELLSCAAFFMKNYRIYRFFVLDKSEDSPYWQEKVRNLGGEGRLPVIGRALTRTGRLWLSELAKSSDARFMSSEKGRDRMEETLSDLFDYILIKPETALERTMTWKALLRRAREHHDAERIARRNDRIDWDDTFMTLREEDRDLWWSPIAARHIDVDGCHIEELCTSNDLLSESLEQRNCVASYVGHCVYGGYHVFRIEGTERATAGVVAGKAGWYCEQVRGYRNAPAGKMAWACVVSLLRFLNESGRQALSFTDTLRNLQLHFRGERHGSE